MRDRAEFVHPAVTYVVVGCLIALTLAAAVYTVLNT